MQTLTAVIVDDEVVMAELLKRLLNQHGGIQVIGVCHDGEDALKMLKELKPDLVFLDIQMPAINGLEVAALLDQEPGSPLVIFVTAYDNYAIKAFEVNALDYILKPFDDADIRRVLRKVRKVYLNRAADIPDTSIDTSCHRPAAAGYVQRLCVAVDEKMEIISPPDIQYISAEDRAVFIYTVNGCRYQTKYTLHEFEQKLDPSQFFRCHRNYIVNMNEVRHLSPWFNRGYLLTLKGNSKAEIPVSRANTKKLEQYIEL